MMMMMILMKKMMMMYIVKMMTIYMMMISMEMEMWMDACACCSDDWLLLAVCENDHRKDVPEQYSKQGQRQRQRPKIHAQDCNKSD